MLAKMNYIRMINLKINNAKFVHMMHNDKFAVPFVNFLNKNYDIYSHIVLCRRICDLPFPIADNVLEFDSLNYINLFPRSIQKIFCHSLFDMELIYQLYMNSEWNINAYWIIWGGDLYEAKRDVVNDDVRKKMKAYIGNPDDCKLAKKIYHSNAVSYYAQYCFPVDIKLLNSLSVIKTDSTLHIQVNNSCDNTIVPMLMKLDKFKNENIKVFTILSYGDMQYKESIIRFGKKIFGKKFYYIEKMLSPDEYAVHLSKIDVMVMNRDRQAGVGNTFALLYLCKKVFIKSNISTFKDFTEKGLKIYDTDSIEKIDFMTFKDYPCDIAQNNKKKILQLFDEPALITQWNKIFSSD